MQAKEQAAK